MDYITIMCFPKVLVGRMVLEPNIVVSCEMLLLLGLCGVQCGVWCAGSVFSLYSVQCVVCTVQCGVWCVECVHYIIFIFLELVRPGLPPAQPAAASPPLLA